MYHGSISTIRWCSYMLKHWGSTVPFQMIDRHQQAMGSCCHFQKTQTLMLPSVGQSYGMRQGPALALDWTIVVLNCLRKQNIDIFKFSQQRNGTERWVLASRWQGHKFYYIVNTVAADVLNTSLAKHQSHGIDIITRNIPLFSTRSVNPSVIDGKVYYHPLKIIYEYFVLLCVILPLCIQSE